MIVIVTVVFIIMMGEYNLMKLWGFLSICAEEDLKLWGFKHSANRDIWWLAKRMAALKDGPKHYNTI